MRDEFWSGWHKCLLPTIIYLIIFIYFDRIVYDIPWWAEIPLNGTVGGLIVYIFWT